MVVAFISNIRDSNHHESAYFETAAIFAIASIPLVKLFTARLPFAKNSEGSPY
jgi:hypothetical protein